MNLRLSSFTKAAVAVAIVATVVVMAGGTAHASNMGFKMNRVVSGLSTFPVGQNEVALPFKNPYVTAQDVCVALGLTAATGKVTQINATLGTALSHTCGNAGPYTLLVRVGMRITNPTNINGIIVGSDIPGQSVTLAALSTFPKGQNSYPVLYHTTAVTAQDLCTQASLTVGVGKVARFNASGGTVQSHTCGNAGPFSLVLGESVIITDSAAHTFVPPHF